ncbi:pentatricopeptide repeat-containing protein At1g10910, chloroplastic-like [Telopea speciosissima]|uniref:pentatricopeptide repeat-containing protein At1g10910, chloroplastic-like n=1 Tax=Telopea speciosissima TaxID=54955 RepID=UPI001CC49BCD|nr:pentatricopeptide repeat-containing protein At1g10910, chloroplastic-like [Telopea speciosissima]
MEIAVLGGGLQHILNLPSPIVTSPSISTTEKNKRKSYWLTFASTTLNESQLEPAQVSAPSTTALRKTSLTPYSARRAAVVYVQKCADLDSALSRSGEVLQVQDLNVILRHFGKLNRWKDVSQLFDWMQKNGKVNVGSYSSYIKFMGKSLNPIKVLEMYNGIQDKSLKNNVSVCNSVLSCLVRNGKFESSIKLFDQMKQCGLIPDVVTYSTLLAGCIKVKHGYSKALQLLRELEDSGLGMDIVIYGTLIAICASSGQSIEAESYFEKMKKEGYSPNVFHYSSLLNAYSVDGNHLKADELVSDMKSAGIVPNKVFLIFTYYFGAHSADSDFLSCLLLYKIVILAIKRSHQYDREMV